MSNAEQTFTRGAHSIHVRFLGRPLSGEGSESGGAPVLFLHSGGFTSRQWRRLAEALSPTHAVLLPDFVAYGKSSPVAAGAPFHFRDDLALIEQLAATIPRPFHVVGHSYGGLIALQLALRLPAKVRSLALFEPVAFGVIDGANADAEAGAQLDVMRTSSGEMTAAKSVSDAWLESFVDWWNGPGAWKGMNDETKNAFRQVSWKLSQEVHSLLGDRTTLAAYGAIAAPTLFLTGETSPAVERRVVELLAGALPHATLERFTGAGHMAPITDSGPVNAAVVRHIEASETAAG